MNDERQSINTDGGATIGRDVGTGGGNFTGRDSESVYGDNNTIYRIEAEHVVIAPGDSSIGSKSDQKRSQTGSTRALNKDKKRFWESLPGILTGIAAIITAVGGAITILNQTGIVHFALASPSPSVIAKPSTLSVTNAITYIQPTSLHSLVTTIPTVTSQTNVTPYKPLIFAPGEDFENNCISGVWTPFNGDLASKNKFGCWQLDNWGILAQNRNLLIVVDNFTNVTSHSIFTRLSENVDIAFTIHINKLKTVAGEDGSFLLGIGDTANGLLAGKFLIYRVIDPSSPIYVLFGESAMQNRKYYFHNYTEPEDIIFSIRAELLTISINGIQIIEPISVSAREKQAFWVGYRFPKNGSVSAIVSAFRIDNK